jgi:pimeloyl-ACP methyl ester carboxylesterase
MTFRGATALRLASGDEIEVSLRASGRATKCLFIHGNPGSASDWDPLLAHLANVADVAAFDLPGFGACPTAADVSLKSQSDWALSVADALGWKQPFFIAGHSHGGGIAQITASRRPERVAGLVLLGTLGFPAHSSYRLLALPGAETVLRTVGRLLQSPRWRRLGRYLVARVIADIFSPEPISEARLARELDYFTSRPDVLVTMRRLALGRPCDQLRAAAPRIGCRVLFLHGRNDKVVPVRNARAVHDLIERSGGASRFEIIERAGHMLIDVQATEVAASMARFMGTRR